MEETWIVGTVTFPGITDASLTRSPDVWGEDWIDHREAPDSIGAFSPGTWADGSSFEGPLARYRVAR